jgi:hypothetical protein
LGQLLKSSLKVTERSTYDENGEFADVDSFFELDGVIAEADLQEARMLVAGALRPAGLSIATKELVRVSLLTKTRGGEDPVDVKTRMRVMAEQMATYPPDIVVDACRFWSNNEKFFPAWSELKDLLDVRVKRRKRLAAAVGHAG